MRISKIIYIKVIGTFLGMEFMLNKCFQLFFITNINNLNRNRLFFLCFISYCRHISLIVTLFLIYINWCIQFSSKQTQVSTSPALLSVRKPCISCCPNVLLSPEDHRMASCGPCKIPHLWSVLLIRPASWTISDPLNSG